MKFRRAEDVLSKINSLPNPSLIVAGPQRLTEQAVAEYLRYGLCVLSKPGKDEQSELQPVHIARLLNRVRKQLGPLLPERTSAFLAELLSEDAKPLNSPDICRQVLYKLELMREVQDLGHGYYLPTPLRLIDLPSGYVLVIGAQPTLEAEKILGIKLKSAGLGRFVHASALPASLRNDSGSRQSLSNWQGIESGLLQWVETYLGWARKDLGTSATDIGSFEVYFPEVTRKTHQYYRWRDSKSWSGKPDQLYLCRSAVRNGPRPYWLGLLVRTQDEVRVIREAGLESINDVQRLLYGFDLLAKVPVTAVFEAHGNHTRLTLTNWLPDQEQRLLHALAVDVSAAPDKFPRIYVFENRWRKDIETLIQSLGIEFRSEPLQGVENHAG